MTKLTKWVMERHDERGPGTPIYRRNDGGLYPRIAVVDPLDGSNSDDLARELIDAANGYELLAEYLAYTKKHRGFSTVSVACYQMGQHEKCEEYEACDCSCHYDDDRFPQSERPPAGYQTFMYG